MTKEQIENAILDIILNADDTTWSDIQAIVSALTNKITNTPKLYYYRKFVYGTNKIYPIDKNIKNILQLFNKHKTLTIEDKKAFKLLGYDFEEQINPNN